MWKTAMTWRALTTNVALNEFYTGAELARWHVHYSYLSAFAHPVSAAAASSLYGRDMPRGIRTDHYATELALLYVGTLAGLEIETFDRMTFREPPVTLTDRDRVLDDVKRFREQAAYFWFPTGPPDLFDRVQKQIT